MKLPTSSLRGFKKCNQKVGESGDRRWSFDLKYLCGWQRGILSDFFIGNFCREKKLESCYYLSREMIGLRERSITLKERKLESSPSWPVIFAARVPRKVGTHPAPESQARNEERFWKRRKSRADPPTGIFERVAPHLTLRPRIVLQQSSGRAQPRGPNPHRDKGLPLEIRPMDKVAHQWTGQAMQELGAGAYDNSSTGLERVKGECGGGRCRDVSISSGTLPLPRGPMLAAIAVPRWTWSLQRIETTLQFNYLNSLVPNTIW